MDYLGVVRAQKVDNDLGFLKHLIAEAIRKRVYIRAENLMHKYAQSSSCHRMKTYPKLLSVVCVQVPFFG